MDQHNQKSLLPDFSSNGFTGQFNGIPHGNSNSLMSTLHSLQMQSMGNQMIPQSDLQCDLQNQLLLEQIQLRAMQSVYNSFNGGQKLDPKFSQPTQPQTNLTLPQLSSIAGNEPSTSNNIFSSIPSTSRTQNNASQHTIPSTNIQSLSIQSSMMLDANKLSNNLNLKPPQLAQTTIPQAQTAVEDWMKNICVDSLLDPFKDRSQTSVSAETLLKNVSIPPCTSAITLNTSVSMTPSTSAQIPADPPPVITQHAQHDVPTTSKAAAENTLNSTINGMDYDEVHDDLDNIFGMSLAENDVRSGSMYRRPSSTDKGLSPIAFTPPDSPQAELTFDEIFGISAASSKVPNKDEEPANDKPKNETVNNVAPSTSSEQPLAPCPSAKPVPTPTSKAEDDFVNSFVKPKNIPVYKQKAALMSLEARENARKEDPNYDAFEFEDDDDMVFGGGCADPRREPETVKKSEHKTKSVYITGVGFEILNEKEKEHGNKVRTKHFVQTVSESLNDKLFFTIADEIRAKKDKQMTCSLIKPEQSISTECAKNMRKVTQDEPVLPKFVIRIEKLPVQEEPMMKKRYKRRKNKSDNDDSDFDDMPYRRRKKTKKVYSLLKTSDVSYRKTVLDFPVGPCVSEADKKRVGCFGPAEGILPKGTYVVCKADILKEDCAVWRVDNQNLLQKFPPLRDVKGQRIVYRSSSTYSGWCEQISSQYFRVSVKIIKQTRSETTVEPEVPLSELFTASSVEWFKGPATVYFKEENNEKIDDDIILTEPRRVSLNTLINASLVQVFTPNHVEGLLENNDWTYSRSKAEIVSNNRQCEELIKKRIPVEPRHNKWIQHYTRLAISKSSFNCLTKCQICKRKKPRRVIHFFDKTVYNEKLVVENVVDKMNDKNEKEEESDEEFPPVADAISCGRCSMAVDFLHKMHHIQFHLLRICEDKLEEIGTKDIDLTSEKIVEKAKADKFWTLGVIQQYCQLWDQVRYEFRDV